jgi:hypothetical protein
MRSLKSALGVFLERVDVPHALDWIDFSTVAALQSTKVVSAAAVVVLVVEE